MTTSIAERTRPAVTGISSNFMLDGATYAVGGDAGFNGMDFYGAGRGGVLGRGARRRRVRRGRCSSTRPWSRPPGRVPVM